MVDRLNVCGNAELPGWRRILQVQQSDEAYTEITSPVTQHQVADGPDALFLLFL